jgi:hypothetical protein
LTAATQVSFVAASMLRMMAAPMMVASAIAEMATTCSRVVMPKPTPTGSLVCARTRSMNAVRSAMLALRPPVVPVTLTQ